MSTQGPDLNELIEKGKTLAKEMNWNQETFWKGMPYAIGAACVGSFLKRPLTFSVGVAALSAVAGPQVLEAGRQWAKTEIEKRTRTPK